MAYTAAIMPIQVFFLEGRSTVGWTVVETLVTLAFLMDMVRGPVKGD
jgi:hypothetical protein